MAHASHRWCLLLGLLSGCSLLVNHELDSKGERRNVGDHDAGGDAAASPSIDAAADSGPSEEPNVVPDASVDAASDDDADVAPPTHDSGQPEPQDVKFCVGVDHACGLLPTGEVVCWGGGNEGQTEMPGGLYREVSCGDYHTCAITTAGDVACAGRNRDGQRIPPVGSFVAIAAGDAHACALDGGGYAHCWGLDDHGQAAPPAEVRFKSITAGEAFSCGVRQSDSGVTCWGYGSTNRTDAPQGVAFRSIDAGRAHACGVDTDGFAHCWGEVAFQPPALVDVREVSAGNWRSCAVLGDASLHCWNYGIAELPADVVGPFAHVAAGDNAVCVLPATGNLQCFGIDGVTTVVPAPPGFPDGAP